MVSLDPVSGEGDAYRLGWTLGRHRCGRRMSHGKRCRSYPELALEHHLELMARGLVQPYVKGSEEAVKGRSGDDDFFSIWNKWLRLFDHENSITSDGDGAKVALNVTNITVYFGRSRTLFEVCVDSPVTRLMWW